MKTRTKKIAFEKIEKIKRPSHKNPVRPNLFFRKLIQTISIPDIKAVKFSYTKTDMDRAGKGPYLVLMNHSSFIDFEIAHKILAKHPFCVVTTSDAFIGMSWLMRQIGCIPTQKFVNDITLLNDMEYALKKLDTSVLMYPEASYTFDGCATPLPQGLGRLIQKLGVPVLSIHTEGAFARQPLYNVLQKRNVRVTADVSCIISKEDIEQKSVEELDEILKKAFTFDNFAWQYENKVKIDEPFRADGLNRILYKCANCKTEGEMVGKGTKLKCEHCGKEYELDEYGRLKATEGETEFPHIPDWYAWERECVKEELVEDKYKLDVEVDIGVMIDYKAIYMVGSGRLVHDMNGFTLTGCDGKLEYRQKPLVSYGLYSDYYWYEIADVISIGNRDILYYCFPKGGDVVAKTRIAAEEMYKLCRARRRRKVE